MLDTIKGLLRDYWKTALIAVVSAVFGVMITDLKNFRDANREIVKRQIEASEKADHDMNAILQKFANSALGKSSTNADDLQTLKSTVQDSFTATERLKNYFPEVANEVNELGEALVSLQKSAETLGGPANGKQFVESVSRYYETKQNLEKRIAALQTRWRPI